MSFLFLFWFLLVLAGKEPKPDFTNDVFIVWALFSIADALWFKGR